VKMKLFFLSLISLFTVSAVQANVIIPSMITWNGVDSIFGWWLILFGFVIECVCFYQFLNKSIGQTIILSAFINLFSSLMVLMHRKRQHKNLSCSSLICKKDL